MPCRVVLSDRQGRRYTLPRIQEIVMPSVQDPALDQVEVADGKASGPTRTRFRVLALACGLAVLTYIHRVGFATASAEMRGPLGLSDRDLGWLMAAFMVAYGVFEMPWGLLGDRLGV